MPIYHTTISIAGSQQDQQNFKNNLQHCIDNPRCSCGIMCPLIAPLRSKKHRVMGSVVDVYHGKYGLEFDMKTKNATMKDVVMKIAMSYPSLIFRASAYSESACINFDETYVYKNDLTLVGVFNTAIKHNSFWDNCNQVVEKGRWVRTADGPALIDNITKTESKINIQIYSRPEIMTLDQNDITRLNPWDDRIDFLFKRISADPKPLFDLGCLYTSGKFSEIIQSDDALEQVCNLLCVGHSYGDWQEVDAQTIASNNDAIKLGGNIISKHQCYNDNVIIITEIAQSKTLMIFESDLHNLLGGEETPA